MCPLLHLIAAQTLNHSLDLQEGASSAHSACVSSLQPDMPVLAPTRTPTVPHFPVPYASSHHHCEVIALYVGRAAFENAALVAAPVPRIHSHNHRPELQPLRELLAGRDLIVILQKVWFFQSFSLAEVGLRAVDGTDIWILLINRHPIFLKVIVNRLGCLPFQATGTAIYNFLLGQSNEIILQFQGHIILPILQHCLLIYLKLHSGSDCKDVTAIKIPHVLNRRHEVTPIIVIIILKLCDLQVSLTLGHRRDYVIQLLEL